MNRDTMVRHALRGTALAIAIAAAIDPAATSQRSSKPQISVVAGRGARDSALATNVQRTLAKDFTVLPASFAHANATVLVGDALPTDEASIADVASPTFAVTGDTTTPQLSLDAVQVPSSAPLDARVPVLVRAHAIGATGRHVTIALASDGGTVDQIVRPISTANEIVTASLAYLPTASGAAPLHVVATLGDSRDSARADLVVDVRDTRWPVLFFDPHPSWMSTFVRRAVERDRRFVVSSRVVTTRGVSTDVGQPSQLDDLAGLARFDAIVVGAPDGLTDTDVRGLDAFLRRRGGRVILLFDAPPTGTIRRLIGTADWIGKTENPSVSLVSAAGDSARLRASELAWPSPLPDGARALAWVRDASSGRAAVWQSPVGAGDVVVSGAFDAWRYRDAASSTFEQYWQTLIANEASSAPPPVSVHVPTPVLRPGERGEVLVTVRDPSLQIDRLLQSSGASGASVQSTVTASIDVDGHKANVSLWPADAVGEFRGSFRAPSAPGSYRLVVTADGAAGDAPLVVANAVSTATPGGLDVLRAWVASRGGQTIAASAMAGLPALLVRALQPTPRAELWHPMRSAWWLAAFIVALSAEWWMRRRRGLA